jgi:hypothetical protein
MGRKFVDSVRASVNGTDAIVLGAVIGVAYVLAGVPHPLLFAVLTMALAMVPLGAWAALAMMTLLIHGINYAALADDPQPNIAHFAISPFVFPFGVSAKASAGRFIDPLILHNTALYRRFPHHCFGPTR